MHLAKINVPLYIRNKRFTKLNNWLRRKKKKNLKVSDRNAIIAEQGNYSKIVEMIALNCFSGTVKTFGKTAYFKAPKVFSIIKNPEESLLEIGRLAAQCIQADNIDKVQLDFSAVVEMDLSANAILDLLVEEIDAYGKKQGKKIKGKKIHWEGSYPASPELKRFIKAIGVIKFLDVKHEKVKHLESKRLRVFEASCKHYVRVVRPQMRNKVNKVTADFADHIDDCLKTVKKKLTKRGRSNLCKYVAEILDNAEQHSGMYHWAIQGYLDTSAEDLICEIVIFNFGESISDRFLSLKKDDYTFGRIAPYVLRHGNYIYNGEMRRADLYTLIALQQSVSTKNLNNASTRGNGTYDLIQFFDLMYQAFTQGASSEVRPVMKLLSGSSQILFDGTYEMRINPTTKLGEIAFNKDNDLTKRPDPTYVNGFKKVKLPGTCLSIKFPLPSKASVPVSA